MTTVGADFSNDGTVTAQSGNLTLNGSLANWNGTTQTLTGGTWNLLGTLRFAGASRPF